MSRIIVVLSCALMLALVGCKTSVAPFDGNPQLTNGLVAYYAFDGDVSDGSTFGNNGVLDGAGFTSDRFGNPDGALLTGEDKLAHVPGSPSLNALTNEFTISVWARIDEWKYGWSVFVSKRKPDQWPRQFHLGLSKSMKLCMIEDGHAMTRGWQMAQIDAFMREFPKDRTWFNLIAVKDARRLKVYLDGKLVGSGSCRGGCLLPSDCDMLIGSDPDTGASDAFVGAMDDLALWSRALTEDEVRIVSDVSSQQ